MKKIKFRIWDGDHMMDISNAYKLDYASICEDEIRTEFEGIILMQFTGISDKNGKEIFEGDILSYDGEGSYKVVKWSDKFLCYIAEYKVPAETLFEDLWSLGRRDTYEVIGNIYSNPELLTNSV